MSLVFQVKSVHIRKPDEQAAAWLESRGLKVRYGNIKQRPVDKDGYTEYKQRSRTDKTDAT